jgi:hypothetical protein
VIKDRLTYGRKAPLQASKRERKHRQDITWTLRAMPAPEWVVENWPGSATVITVQRQGHPRWQANRRDPLLRLC